VKIRNDRHVPGVTVIGGQHSEDERKIRLCMIMNWPFITLCGTPIAVVQEFLLRPSVQLFLASHSNFNLFFLNAFAKQ
jgi:hypothetical protein